MSGRNRFKLLGDIASDQSNTEDPKPETKVEEAMVTTDADWLPAPPLPKEEQDLAAEGWSTVKSKRASKAEKRVTSATVTTSRNSMAEPATNGASSSKAERRSTAHQNNSRDPLSLKGQEDEEDEAFQRAVKASIEDMKKAATNGQSSPEAESRIPEIFERPATNGESTLEFMERMRGMLERPALSGESSAEGERSNKAKTKPQMEAESSSKREKRSTDPHSFFPDVEPSYGLEIKARSTRERHEVDGLELRSNLLDPVMGKQIASQEGGEEEIESRRSGSS